jgi:hypothetical protein
MIDEYRTKARWAIIHCRELGELQDDPRDIGPLMKEIAVDFQEECKAEIMERLWHKHGRSVVRGVQAGFAEYYKSTLLEAADAA